MSLSLSKRVYLSWAFLKRVPHIWWTKRTKWNENKRKKAHTKSISASEIFHSKMNRMRARALMVKVKAKIELKFESAFKSVHGKYIKVTLFSTMSVIVFGFVHLHHIFLGWMREKKKKRKKNTNPRHSYECGWCKKWWEMLNECFRAQWNR